METPRIFTEIAQFARFQQEEATAKDASKKAAFLLAHKEIGKDGRFIAFDDGTVLDTQTNLMWAAKDNGKNINWSGAKSYCDKYRGGGYTDWRMPTRDELAGLYDANKINRYGYKVTALIEISECCPWASETRGSEAAYFNFRDGWRSWGHQSGGNGLRALPVRSGK